MESISKLIKVMKSKTLFDMIIVALYKLQIHSYPLLTIFQGLPGFWTKCAFKLSWKVSCYYFNLPKKNLPWRVSYYFVD